MKDVNLDNEFKIFYNKIYPMVINIVNAIIRDLELSEDITHDSFIKLYERYDEFKDDNHRKYWIIKVAKNLSINQYNKRQREKKIYKNIFKEDKQITIEDNIGKLINFEKSKVLNEVLKLIPIKLKEALLLKEYSDLTYKEISKMMFTTESNAKIRVFRAKKMIYEILKKNEYFDE